MVEKAQLSKRSLTSLTLSPSARRSFGERKCPRALFSEKSERGHFEGKPGPGSQLKDWELLVRVRARGAGVRGSCKVSAGTQFAGDHEWSGSFGPAVSWLVHHELGLAGLISSVAFGSREDYRRWRFFDRS